MTLPLVSECGEGPQHHRGEVEVGELPLVSVWCERR